MITFTGSKTLLRSTVSKDENIESCMEVFQCKCRLV